MHGARMLPSAVAPNRPSARDPGAATALCQHQPVACRPGEQLCHRRQRLLWRQHPRRHRPADSPTCARPKGGLPSLLAAPVFCALGRCDRLINARRSPFYAIISLWLHKNRHPSGKTLGTTYTMGRVLQGPRALIGLLIRKRGYDGSCCILR